MIIEGYASRFGLVDQAGDVIAPEAFRRTLEGRPPGEVRMLFQHRAEEPVGVWQSLRTDKAGLYARGLLLTEIGRARELAALIAGGALDGLSIGFRPVRAARDARSGLRILHDVELVEISVVTFPMLKEARIRRIAPPSVDRPQDAAIATAIRRTLHKLTMKETS